MPFCVLPLTAVALVGALAAPARAGQPAGEFLFWVSNNTYSMAKFNSALRAQYGWTSGEELNGGVGLGYEFDMRWGKPVTNGFGLGLEVMFGSVSKDWGYQGSGLGYVTESFNLTNTPTFFLASPQATSMTCGGTPGGPCTASDFGTLNSGTATGRQIQFGLKLLF